MERMEKTWREIRPGWVPAPRRRQFALLGGAWSFVVSRIFRTRLGFASAAPMRAPIVLVMMSVVPEVLLGIYAWSTSITKLSSVPTSVDKRMAWKRGRLNEK